MGEAFPFFMCRRGRRRADRRGAAVPHRRGVAQCGVMGCWIGRPHAGRGYMQDGVQAAIDFAFGELALRRLEAACMPENRPSSARRLLKSGFSEEDMRPLYLKISRRASEIIVCSGWSAPSWRALAQALRLRTRDQGMSFKISQRRVWDATATLEALGAAEVALWLWEPEADRLRVSGASRALGLRTAGPRRFLRRLPRRAAFPPADP